MYLLTTPVFRAPNMMGSLSPGRATLASNSRALCHRKVLGNHPPRTPPLSQLPTELHPLLPDSPPPCRESPLGDFATTRTLHDTPPEIINNPEDEVQTVLLARREERQGGRAGRRRCTNIRAPRTPHSSRDHRGL